MPKKPPKNGYFYFMMDFRNREQRAGRRFRDMKEVSEAASDEWKQLTQAERDDYNKYAKENRDKEPRESFSKSMEKKYNSQGISFAQLEKDKKEKEARDYEVQVFVHNFVKSMNFDDLKNKVMHLIHVNIFCKTDDDTYYPAEMAICKFSMKEGIIKQYHTFFDPGEIKKGYSYAVKEHSEKTHKITLSFVKQKSEYHEFERIYRDVCTFLELEKNQKVPLFTMYDDVFYNTSLIAVEKTLETLWDSRFSDNSSSWRKHFPVYPLPLFFTHFKNHCGHSSGLGEEIKAFPDSTLANSELNKDTYNYEDKFSCKFHRDEDVVTYCSLSYVLRWAHIIRDHCCDMLGIEIFEPKQEPMDSTESEYRNAPSSSGFNYRDPYEDDNEDDKFADCRSVCSEMSAVSSRTNASYITVGLAPESEMALNWEDDEDDDDPPPRVTRAPGSAWTGANPFQKKNAPPTLSNDNFPVLGRGRALRRFNK